MVPGGFFFCSASGFLWCGFFGGHNEESESGGGEISLRLRAFCLSGWICLGLCFTPFDG
jgi:hypothetical protein